MIDQITLACILALGYPPAKHLENKSKPLCSREMGDADLDEYCRIVEGAIISRASEYDNWVEATGGWDSTIILAVLKKYGLNVRAVVCEANLSDGRCYNPFEVQKTIEIGEYYDIPVEVATLNLRSAEVTELWDESVQARRSHLVGEMMIVYWAMAKMIKEKGQPDGAVFIGSFADSLHNFGFSQLVSLPYLTYEFRQYSDKMMSYLYSPSFLKKVIENTYIDDFVYRLFKWQHPEVKFSDSLPSRERIFDYLLPLFFSRSRLPFSSSISDSFLTDDGQAYLKEWLYENYFKEAVEQITPETMYFWLIWLYQHFHLHGSEKANLEASLSGSTMRACQPYCDLKLVRFLQTMPESWGRGLEWRPTKYPLKHYAREKLKIPCNIIESPFHSYISETEEGRGISPHWELAETLRSSIKLNKDMLDVFDSKWFNVDLLAKILREGDKSNPKLFLNLVGILSLAGEAK